MSTLIKASLAFPAVPFTVLLLVVIGFWLFTLIGLADSEVLDGAGAADTGGALAGLGLGHVPVTIVISFMTLFSWTVSLIGTALLLDSPLAVRIGLGVVVLLIALVVAWALTRAFIAPLRRVFAPEPNISRADLVGRPCLIKTGRVTGDFGQAEVSSPGGGTSIVQVRVHGDAVLKIGDTALIFDYDEIREVFFVTPVGADGLPTTSL
ncbi:hypothetical protein Afil01_19050 [Actinorhabdospora filicis]|uniref:DUF1449 family protein n=1 Tax=Actinorhabdospora filicis TaxID=1785913 RepID=A0A9W6SJF4_9ACTN|nr:hypothetical protein [Actinorhabdospora filicis]GLZ77098.1 hypothetical protein Afil01_19050 [Actinorhabdospora filicis]